MFYFMLKLFFILYSKYLYFCIVYEMFLVYFPFHFRAEFRDWLLELQVLTDILIAERDLRLRSWKSYGWLSTSTSSE